MCIVRTTASKLIHFWSRWGNMSTTAVHESTRCQGGEQKKKRSLFINTANDLQNNYSICFKYPEAIFQYF